MHDLTHRLAALSSAEEFLDFYAVPYEQAVVHVNRLHILKRFHQYLRQARDMEGLGEVELFRRQRELLARAYGDFVRSTPLQEKVFKVFQEAGGQRSIFVHRLQEDLAARRGSGPAPEVPDRRAA